MQKKFQSPTIRKLSRYQLPGAHIYVQLTFLLSAEIFFKTFQNQINSRKDIEMDFA